jgi:DNA polymerase-3 subunit chi
MTRVDFYHLTRSSLEAALPRLLEKVVQSGARAVVMAGSKERVDALSAHLWTYNDRSFLPHGSHADGFAERQPIWLTEADENPNGATVLIITDGARSDKVAAFERCLELFDGNDDAAVSAARQRWTGYKESGHEVTYYQQTERGGWEQRRA